MSLFKRSNAGRRRAAVTASSPPPLTRAPAATPHRVWLEVPFVDNAQVKALGARWDPDRRAWWIASDRWRNGLIPWLPRPPVPAHVLATTIDCWRCGQPTRAIVGVLIAPELHPDEDPWGFVSFADVAPALTALNGAWCSTHGVGTIKERYSRTQERRYVSNGCASCDALLGEFFIDEELIALVVQGVSLTELVIDRVELPGRAIPDDEVSMSLGCSPPQPGELEQLTHRWPCRSVRP